MKKRYSVDGQIYEIPEEKSQDFLKDFPHAIEVKHYDLGNDKYEIPLDQVDAFEKDMPKLKQQSINGQPTYKPTDLLSLAQKAAELDSKTSAVVGSSGTGGAGVAMTPDPQAQAQAKELYGILNSNGVSVTDAKKMASEFSDYPEQAATWDQNGKHPYSKENLLALRQSNPIEYANTLNNVKTTAAIAEAGGTNVASIYNQYNHPAQSLAEYQHNVENQKQLITTYLTGDRQKKALDGLKQSATMFISPTSPLVKSEYDKDDLKNDLDLSQYAGLKSLELFEPERAAQVRAMIKAPIVPAYIHNIPMEAVKNIQSPVAVNTSYESADSTGGTISGRTIDQQVGKENVLRMLSESGRNNAVLTINKTQYELNSAYEKTTDSQEKQRIQQAYLQNQKILEGIKSEASLDDTKYPLTAGMKFDNQVKEALQSEPGLMNYGTERFMKGIWNSGASIRDLATSAFGSDQDKALNAMQGMGEDQAWSKDLYLPENFRSSGSLFTYKFTPDLQKNLEDIENDSSLNSLQKADKQRKLISENQDKVQTVTNPDVGKSKNFLSKATLYSNAGMIGDIASVAAQSYGLGGMGASKLASATMPMFLTSYSDYYNKAIESGEAHPEQYALTHSLILAAAGAIDPQLGIVKRALGNSAAGKIIAGVNENTWNRVLSEGGQTLQKFQNAALGAGKELGKMTSVYGVGTSIANDLSDKVLFNKDINTDEILSHAVEAGKDMLYSSAGLIGVHAITNFKSIPFEQKTRLWELGDNPTVSKLKIGEAVANGEITAAEGSKREALVNKVSDLIQKIPTHDDSGQPLSDKQRIEYLHNLFLKKSADEAKDFPKDQQQKIDEIKTQADEDNSSILSGENKSNRKTTSDISPYEEPKPVQTTQGNETQSIPEVKLNFITNSNLLNKKLGGVETIANTKGETITRDVTIKTEQNKIKRDLAQVGNDESTPGKVNVLFDRLNELRKQAGLSIDENRPDFSVTNETKSISQKGKEIADRLRQFKSKRDILQSNFAGIPVAIWDGAIEATATAIEKGAQLADAIKEGINHIRTNHGDFDEKAFEKFIREKAEGNKSISDYTMEPETGSEKGKRWTGVIPAIRDYFTSNLNHLQKISQESKDKAATYFASSTQAATIMRKAIGMITKQIGENGWEEMRKALIQSRLDGIRERWKEMVKAVDHSSDEELSDAVHGSTGDILDNIEARTPLENLKTDAQTLAASDKFDELRDHLKDAFNHAADNVANMDFSGGRSYNEITGDPKFHEGLKTYKDLVEKPIAENHSTNEGIFSDALGKLKTYFPLIPMDSKGKAFPSGDPKIRKPINLANKLATGLSGEYDTSVKKLNDHLTTAIKANNKAAFVRSLEDGGLLKILRPSDQGSVIIHINGVAYTAKTVDIGDPIVRVVDGKSTYTPAKKAIMPEWLYKELRPMLEKGGFEKNAFGRVMDKITAFALGGIFEPAIHSANLIGGIVNGTPFPGTSILSKTIGNLPITKVFTGIFNVIAEDVTSPKSIEHIQDMARIGLISPKSATWSKKYAEATGAEKSRLWNLSPFLYGRNGVDIKARVLMDRIGLNINPNATPEQRRRFVYQLGNYVKGLEGTLEKTVKRNGIAPFFTASSTFLKNGIKGWLGIVPLPTGGMSFTDRATYKSAQLLSAGAVGIVGTWVALYKAQTGNYPWDDKNSNFMKIPLTDDQKEWLNDHPVTKKLFYRNGKWQDINMGFFNRPLERGGKALGLDATYNSINQEATPGETTEAAMTQSLNSFLTPLTSSPSLHAASVAITGHSPYLTSMRDFSGKYNPQFMQQVRTMHPGLEQMGANSAQAIMDINPLIGLIGHESGFTYKPVYNAEDQASMNYMKMITDMVMPNLFKPHIDNEKIAARLIKRRKAIETTHLKESGQKK